MHYRAECLQNIYSVHSRRLQDRIQSSLSNITHLSLKYYFSLFQMQIFFPYHYNCKIHFKNAIHVEISFFYCIIILLPVSRLDKPFGSSTIDRLESNMTIPESWLHLLKIRILSNRFLIQGQMPAAIDKSFWSRFKIISRQNALKSTDCPRKIPRLIHFWARRSYQSQNSTGYTLKYSNLTHLFRSTKYELMVKRRPFTFYNIIYFKSDISYKCNISSLY